MKKLITFLAIASLMASCSLVVFSDVNDYNGSVILKISLDSVGTIPVYHYVIRDTLSGEFNKISISPDFHFFEVGDTL
jgi:hypothetical protein